MVSLSKQRSLTKTKNTVHGLGNKKAMDQKIAILFQPIQNIQGSKDETLPKLHRT